MRRSRLSRITLGVGLAAMLMCSCANHNTSDATTTSSSQSTDTDNTTKYSEEITTTEPITEEPTTDIVTDMSDEERILEIMASMTLEEKVGQMFIARCPEENADTLASKYHLGGYILFARDFKDKTVSDVQEAIESYQSASSIPMFIGVDEEGGTVNRVSKYTAFRAEAFKSPQALYAEGGYEFIESDAIEKSKLLKSLGINLNFAPVADVSTDSSDFIYSRTLGLGATETATYVKTVVEAMNGEGMGSVLKHFPGYGGNEDTHEGIAYDNRSYQSFLESDFQPFRAGIDSGASMVLVAHNIVYCMDSEYPASLSAKVHAILRDELNFDGVIITDELSMEGVKQFASDTDVAVLAVQAGNDILCCTNFEEQIQAVIDAVNAGTISEERIDQSVSRILKLKIKLGIMSYTT